MNSITVDFEGICTHVTYPYPQVPGPHRVVLARAYDDYVEHYARLIIPVSAAPLEEVSRFAAAPQMKFEGEIAGNYYVLVRGVTLRIGNPDLEQGYRQDQSFLCGIPRLSVIAGCWLGEPYPSVTSAGDTEKAWAYFNVSLGTWTAVYRYLGAAVAVLDCQTEGEPVLCADAFPSVPEVVTPSTSLTIASGSTVTVQYGAKDQDREDDFGIQFRVVDPNRRPPARAQWFDGSPCLTPVPDQRSGLPPSIGPGCSNSLFP